MPDTDPRPILDRNTIRSLVSQYLDGYDGTVPRVAVDLAANQLAAVNLHLLHPATRAAVKAALASWRADHRAATHNTPETTRAAQRAALNLNAGHITTLRRFARGASH